MNKKISSLISVITIIIIMVTCFIMYLKRSEIIWISKVLPISQIDTDKRVVAIACNVYEGREEIKKMLDVLNNERIRISFFIGGIWAESNLDIVSLLSKNGQDVQNHGYYHKKPSTLNECNNIKEIMDTQKLIYKTNNVKTYLFEPPFGDFDDNSLNVIGSIGYKTITWSIDTIDWREDATEELILGRIRRKLHPGAIILMHPKPVTAGCFFKIIRMIKDQGYEIKTVSELLRN